MKAGINHNRFENVGETKASKAVKLYTVESRLALNPRLQLTGIYQHNTDQDLNAYNLKLAWEYKPLSYLYLVVNQTPLYDEENVMNVHETGILKITYLKQF